MKPIESLLKKATNHYYSAVAAHPQARDWYYNVYQIIEGEAEVPNIDSAAGRFGDPWIETRFERHVADEHRHQMVWVDLLKKRNIFNPGSVPPWANFVAVGHAWYAALDKLSNNEQVHPEQLIMMFSGMHALEVLGVQRFNLMADMLRKIDPEVAAQLDGIVKDERFHTSYTRESVMRLGRKYDCVDYAEQCLAQGVKAYHSMGLSLLPRFVDHLRAMGVKFSPWFLLLNVGLKLRCRFAPPLPQPPRMPAKLARSIPLVGFPVNQALSA